MHATSTARLKQQSYVIQMRDGTFVHNHDGINDFVKDPSEASQYYSKEEAERGKVGHHSDMGGSGFRGTIVPYNRVKWMVKNN